MEQVLPAETGRQAKEIIAAGDAAPIAENAKATATVMNMFAQAWQEAGENMASIYVYQNLEEIMASIVSITEKLKIKEIDVVDSGSLDTVYNTININFRLVFELLNRLTELTGINIVEAINPSYNKS